MEVQIRAAQPTDRALIRSQWIRGLCNSIPWLTNECFPAIAIHVRHMTEASPAWVACCPEDPSRVYGFIVADPRSPALLHWIWVRHDFRDLGIGTRLISQVLSEASEKLAPTAWTRALQAFELKRGELFQAPRPDLARR